MFWEFFGQTSLRIGFFKKMSNLPSDLTDTGKDLEKIYKFNFRLDIERRLIDDHFHQAFACLGNDVLEVNCLGNNQTLFSHKPHSRQGLRNDFCS